MPERLNGSVLKTEKCLTALRGFESLPLRQDFLVFQPLIFQIVINSPKIFTCSGANICAQLYTREQSLLDHHIMQKLLTHKELSELLQVKLSTVYKWVNYEYIPFVRIGSLIRFKEQKVEEWLRKRARKGRDAYKMFLEY